MQKKCKCSTNTVKYLGHLTCSRLLQLAFKTTDDIGGLEPPTSIMKL